MVSPYNGILFGNKKAKGTDNAPTWMNLETL